MDILNDKKDYRTMNMMLEYLAGYGIDHHSRAMFNSFRIFIEHEMPNIKMYMDSRLIQTDQVQKIKKGMLKEKDPMGIQAASIWVGP